MTMGSRSALPIRLSVEFANSTVVATMNELISRRLRHRVRTLSTILGETMTNQHGDAFLEKVEEIFDGDGML